MENLNLTGPSVCTTDNVDELGVEVPARISDTQPDLVVKAVDRDEPSMVWPEANDRREASVSC
jgi:hypothetical protein